MPSRRVGSTLYWKLSAFYLFYFAALGALIPYWGLYLKHLGFQPAEIGELLAILAGTKIVAPNLLGWIADQTGRRMFAVRVASLLALVCFCGVFIHRGYWWLAATMAFFSFFWNAALPQFEATTFGHLGSQSQFYSRIRLWGSIGFILLAVTLGPWLDIVGADKLPLVLLFLFGGIWGASLIVPESADSHRLTVNTRFREVLLGPMVLSLLVVCFLMQASHGPYYSFFSIYLDEHGYTRGVIGLLWALGVIAEIGVFLLMQKLLALFGFRNLLLASLGLTVIRWLLIPSFVEEVLVLIFAQFLHAASFGLFHAVAISLINHFFTGRHQGRGQALYSSLSFGAGGALGSYLAGHLWGAVGPVVTYCAAAGVTLGATLIAYFGLRGLSQ